MTTTIKTTKQVYGVDLPLVLSAAKSAGVYAFPPQIMEALTDCVADAVARFDASKGSTLSRWVFSCVRWQSKRYIMAAKGGKTPTISMSTPLSGDEKLTIGDTLVGEDGTQTEETLDSRESLIEAASSLDSKGQVVMGFVLKSYQMSESKCLVKVPHVLAHLNDLGNKKETPFLNALRSTLKGIEQGKKTLVDLGMEMAEIGVPEHEGAHSRQRSHKVVQGYMTRMRSILQRS